MSEAASPSWEDLEAIKKLKARYFRFVDSKAWDDLPALFTPDAVLEVTGNPPSVAAFVDWLRTAMADAVMVHHGHMPEIDFVDSMSATGRWTLSFYLEWEVDGAREGLQGYRIYEEQYRKEEGEWRISAMRTIAIPVDSMAAVRHPGLPSPA